MPSLLVKDWARPSPRPTRISSQVPHNFLYNLPSIKYTDKGKLTRLACINYNKLLERLKKEPFSVCRLAALTDLCRFYLEDIHLVLASNLYSSSCLGRCEDQSSLTLLSSLFLNSFLKATGLYKDVLNAHLYLHFKVHLLKGNELYSTFLPLYLT
jgi:hypothetical protein